MNEATELVTGVPREQLIGTDFARYFTEPQKAEAGYQKVLAERPGAGLSADDPARLGPHHRGALQRHGLSQRSRRGAGRVRRGARHHRAQGGRAAAGLHQRLLALFAQKTSASEYLHSVVDVIRQWSGCQALGIRSWMDDAGRYLTKPGRVSSRGSSSWRTGFRSSATMLLHPRHHAGGRGPGPRAPDARRLVSLRRCHRLRTANSRRNSERGIAATA